MFGCEALSFINTSFKILLLNQWLRMLFIWKSIKQSFTWKSYWFKNKWQNLIVVHQHWGLLEAKMDYNLWATHLQNPHLGMINSLIVSQEADGTVTVSSGCCSVMNGIGLVGAGRRPMLSTLSCCFGGGRAAFGSSRPFFSNHSGFSNARNPSLL